MSSLSRSVIVGTLVLVLVGAFPVSALPSETFRDRPECLEMVVVPAGSFTMGSPSGEAGRYENEGPQHQVIFPMAFAVGKFEVTFAQWDACVAAGGCGGWLPSDEGWGRDNRLVISVSWEDIRDYIRWLSGETGEPYRLLSEAEWEYAARAGTHTRYSWADGVGSGNANCNGCGSQWDDRMTAPVGSFAPNAFGPHDMHGNVNEWVEDCWHGSYRGAPRDDAAWTGRGDCGRQVFRGGSWSLLPRVVRAAFRLRSYTGERIYDVGFRVSRGL